jgi:hypothetical protein
MSEQYYTLGTTQADHFDTVHDELTDGTLLGRAVECTDHKNHSPTKGEFLLTEAESETLRADDRILFINLTPARYPEIFNATEDDLRMDIQGSRYNRYGKPVRNYHYWASGGGYTGPDFAAAEEEDVSRASSQLIRPGQKRSPWIAQKNLEGVAFIKDPVQKGAGENVDVICMDNGSWIGHVEFINPNRVNFDKGAALNPQDYTGGNVLPGNGYCDVLDVLLDGPYYIDPDWFNADAGSRLETRWDGTIVPTETAAHNWWRDSTQRSAEFASFGNILVNTNYTRAGSHGSNSAYPTSATADHGTQCASLIYGRTHGWAYNANKWHMNLYSNNNIGSFEIGFDLCKIFHQYKPVNPIYGTQDPTIGSNSWGFRATKSSNHHYFQGDLFGTEYAAPGPQFLRHLGGWGDGGRWKSEMYNNSMTQAGTELIDSGFIFVAAAGNSNQTQVNPDDPNYDNHISNGTTHGVYSDLGGQLFSEFGYTVTGTTNRRGFPQHIGKTESQTLAGNTTVKFPAINIGALASIFKSPGSRYPKSEYKARYSDMGNAIDLYAPADGTLAATVGTFGVDVERFDDSYSTLSTLQDCRDTRFSGTSAACPVAAGFLATILQYNRGWTYEDLRSWIQTMELQTTGNGLDYPDSDPNAPFNPYRKAADFYDDLRGTTPDDASWGDAERLQGGDARVLYLAPFPISTPHPNARPKRIVNGPLNLNGAISIRFGNR